MCQLPTVTPRRTSCQGRTRSVVIDRVYLWVIANRCKSTQEFSRTPTGGTALLIMHHFVSKRRVEAGSAEEKVPLNSNYFVLFVVLMRFVTALHQVGILIKQIHYMVEQNCFSPCLKMFTDDVTGYSHMQKFERH